MGELITWWSCGVDSFVFALAETREPHIVDLFEEPGLRTEGVQIAWA
jgi:hypothetical protein